MLQLNLIVFCGLGERCEDRKNRVQMYSWPNNVRMRHITFLCGETTRFLLLFLPCLFLLYVFFV